MSSSRKVTLLVLVSCLLFGAASPGIGAKKSRSAKRTVEVRYEGGAVPYLSCVDCPKIQPRPGERFVSVEVIDDAAPIGYVDIAWFTPTHDYFPVCGQTEEPQRIPSRAELTAYPWHVPDTTCPNGFSTTGTIRFTFSLAP